jgi:DNA-directed RNA polymerase
MKVVLCHTVTRRYYQAPGKWVRRADNAMSFEDFGTAIEFSRQNRLSRARPVQRLAPYLMPLLHRPQPIVWQSWMRGDYAGWYSKELAKLSWN